MLFAGAPSRFIASMTDPAIKIEVAYATPEKQFLVSLELPAPVTVGEAIRQSGVLTAFPELRLELIEVGIFSKSSGLDAELSPGDRVEIYRPLQVDPKEARRLRALARKKKENK